MADETVTTADVLAYSGARKMNSRAGEAIAIGKWCYQKASDRRWYKSDRDNAEADAIGYGVSLTQADSAGQPIQIAYAGDIDPGFTVVVAKPYVGGGAAGAISAVDDLDTDDYTRIVGVGITASKLRLICFNSGVKVPA